MKKIKSFSATFPLEKTVLTQRSEAATKGMKERIPQQTEIMEQTEKTKREFRLFHYFRLLRYSLFMALQTKNLSEKQEVATLLHKGSKGQRVKETI